MDVDVTVLERVLAPSEGADGQPQALIVVPTRELGLQVARDLAAAGSTRGVRVLPIYGGVAYEPQVEALKKGVEILVGTPGRLLDLCKQKQLKLSSIRALVLDINIKRKAIYMEKAREQNATPEAYALTAGCQAIARTVPGEKYMAPDGTWQTRTSAPPIRDARCP